MRRSLLVLLVVAALVLCVSVAYGGSYQVTSAQGGKFTVNQGGTPSEVPYSLVDGVYGGWVKLGPPATPVYKSISAEGTMTQTLGWVGAAGESVPDYVVVTEMISVDATSDSYAPTTLTGDSLLGGSPYFDSSYTAFYGQHQRYFVQRKRLLVGAPTLTFSRSISITMPDNHHVSCDARVQYYVTADPVEIVLTNTTPFPEDSGDRTKLGVQTMVGKPIKAELRAGAPGSSIYFSDHHWTVPGAPIKNFLVQGGLSNPNPNTGGKVEISAQDLEVAQPVWYWWLSGNVMVSCATVINVEGTYTPITVKIRVNINRPNTIELKAETEDSDNLLSLFKVVNSGAGYKFDSLRMDAGDPVEAMRFTGKVNHPSEPLGPGKWFFLQLVQRRESLRYEKIGGIATPVDVPLPPDNETPWNLDGALAYGSWIPNSNAVRNVGPDPYYAVDSPNWTLPSEILVQNDPYTLKRMNILFSGKMFLMYQPPGPNTIPVPVSEVRWGWRAYADFPFPLHNTLMPNSAIDERGFYVLPLEFPQWGNRYKYPNEQP